MDKWKPLPPISNPAPAAAPAAFIVSKEFLIAGPSSSWGFHYMNNAMP